MGTPAGAGCGAIKFTGFHDIQNALARFVGVYVVNYLRCDGYGRNAFVCNALTVRTDRVCESGCLNGVDGQAVVALDLNPSDDVWHVGLEVESPQLFTTARLGWRSS